MIKNTMNLFDTIRVNSIIAVLSLAIISFSARADQLAAMVAISPTIISAEILELTPDVSISDFQSEFGIKAKVGTVVKGDLKKDAEIKVVIKLPSKDQHLLEHYALGMKKGGHVIMFLRPQLAADGKTLMHYRFTEIPLGCLPFDFYSLELLKRECNKPEPKK
jgi:hypothetical protein